jgi:hypothetical protein
VQQQKQQTLEHREGVAHSLPAATEGWLRWRVVAVLTGVALAVRLFHLDYRGMWTDEFHTLDSILLDLDGLIRDRLQAGHLPLYFLILKWWSSVAGLSEWALRFPSAVAGALLVPALATFGRRYMPPPVVWGMMVLGAFNSLAVSASQEARMYSMLAVTTTMAHYQYFRTVRQPEWGQWGWYGFWILLSAALQPVAAIMAAGHFAFSFTVRREYPAHARRARAIGLTLLGVAVPAAAAYILSQKRFLTPAWDAPSLEVVWNRLAQVAFGRGNLFDGHKNFLAVLMTVCFFGLYLDWRAGRSGRPLTLAGARPQSSFLKFCVLSVAVPAGLLFVSRVFFTRVLGPERYFIPLTAPMFALTLWGLACLPGLWRPALALTAAGFVAAGLWGQWTDPGTGLREVARWLAPRVNEGDVIVLRQSATAEMGLRYYGVKRAEFCHVPERKPPEVIVALVRDCTAGKGFFWLVNYRDNNNIVEKALAQRAPSLATEAERYRFGEATAARLMLSADDAVTSTAAAASAQ